MVAPLPSWPIVFSTALVDSINPCAIGVLVLLIATLLSLSKNRKKMLTIGLIYITAVFITYLAAGFGLTLFIQKLNLFFARNFDINFSEILTIAVSILVIILGLIEIKDFFWYGQGISLQIPSKRAEQIKKMMKTVSIPGSIILGIFVAAVELPCTGGPYLLITNFLALIGLNMKVFWLLVVYNFIFVLPLLVILLAVYFGVSAKAVKSWKDKEKKWMRLFMGLVMIALGITLILITKGVIRLGVG